MHSPINRSLSHINAKVPPDSRPEPERPSEEEQVSVSFVCLPVSVCLLQTDRQTDGRADGRAETDRQKRQTDKPRDVFG